MAEWDCIAIFESTHAALAAERAARAAGLATRMGPVPRSISADCNMGMLFAGADRPGVAAVLAAAAIETRIFELAR